MSDRIVKVAFLGNCQASSLCASANAMDASSTADFKHFHFFSCEISARGGIKEAKNFFLRHMSLEDYRHLISKGFIMINPSLGDLHDYACDYCVLSMFHETAYYRHRSLKFLIAVTDHAFPFCHSPQKLLQDLNSDFDAVSVDPSTYFTRFLELVDRLVANTIAKKYLIFKRLSSSAVPARTKSWLSKWPSLLQACQEFMSRAQELYGDEVSIVDADSYVSDIQQSSFVVDFVTETLPTALNTCLALDIEHLPPVVFDKITSDILSQCNITADGMSDSHCGEAKTSMLIRSFVESLTNGNHKKSLVQLEELLAHQFKLDPVLIAMAAYNDRYYKEQVKNVLDNVHERHYGKINDIYYALKIAYDVVYASRETLREECAGCRVALWGAGGRAKYLLEQTDFFNDLDIRFIIDASAEKHGNRFCGYDVVSPQGANDKIDIVFVASVYYNEIVSCGERIPSLSAATFFPTEGIVLRAIIENKSCNVSLAL